MIAICISKNNVEQAIIQFHNELQVKNDSGSVREGYFRLEADSLPVVRSGSMPSNRQEIVADIIRKLGVGVESGVVGEYKWHSERRKTATKKAVST